MAITLVEGYVNGQKYELGFPEGTDEDTITRATEKFFADLPIHGVPGSQADLFEHASNFVLENEGGDADDPDDAGGRTRFGISQRSFPNENIEELTLERAKEIYRNQFWEGPGFDKLPYDELAVKTFDVGVNMGPRAAGKLLQRAINDTAKSEEDMVAVDGEVGPQTLAAIATRDRQAVLDAYVQRVRKRYGDIVKSRPSQAKFLRGWLKRADKVPAIP